MIVLEGTNLLGVRECAEEEEESKVSKVVFLVLIFVLTLSLTAEASGKTGICTGVRDSLVDKARSWGLFWRRGVGGCGI